MRSVTLVVVNYRSASLAVDAIASARAAASGALRVVVVDNSVDAREAGMLQPHADTIIAAERNLGYAAAINRARPHVATDIMIVANPDVVFGPQSIDRLIDVDAAVAGPAFSWDDRGEWLLPPAELHTGSEVLDRALASRSRSWMHARDRRRMRNRRAFWSLSKTTPMRALSGSILAIRTAAFDTAGGFDERFRLYFEENDFLRRVKGPVLYVPEARCRHIYNQSAGVSPEANALYAESEEAYRRKWLGPVRAAVLKRLERPLTAPEPPAATADPISVPPNAYVEASPLPSFDTAAGHFPRGAVVEFPDSIWSAYRGRSLYLRVIDRTSGRILATHARAKISP